MDKNLKQIATGLILFALGLSVAYFYIYPIVTKIQNHVSEINYSIKYMLASPILIVVGLYYSLCRPQSEVWADLNRKDKTLFIIAGLVMAAAIFLLIFWFHNLLKFNGYEFKI